MPNPLIAITEGSKQLNLLQNPAAAPDHCQADCQSAFTRRNAFICLIGLVVSGQICGQIAPRADAVWDQARIIVLGRVVSASATDIGQQAKGGYLGVVTRVDIVLQTKRCYKNAGIPGECERLTTFFYDWPQLGNTSRRLVMGDDAVIFITDHAGPLTAEDPDGVWPLNGLVQGLGRREQALLPRGKAGLQDDLSAALASADGDLRRQGFFYLQGFTALSPQAMAEAKRIVVLHSESIDDRLAALHLMLTDPQLKTVAIAASMAETEGKTIIASPLASQVGLSLGNVSDPSCLPALIKVLESSLENWHYGAISGLRKIGSAAAVPALIKALDDQEPLARYAAVVTLFELTKMTDGEEYGPGLGPFEEDPEKYVRRWKQWWANGGKAKYEAFSPSSTKEILWHWPGLSPASSFQEASWRFLPPRPS